MIILRNVVLILDLETWPNNELKQDVKTDKYPENI